MVVSTPRSTETMRPTLLSLFVCMAVMTRTADAFTVTGQSRGSMNGVHILSTTTTTTLPILSRRSSSLLKVSSTTTAEAATAATSDTGSDFGSAMPTKVDPHEIIGVEPEKLALGIDPDDFLEWIGTRNDLIDKFQKDNPSYALDRIEVEVDKFMMDAEMANGYIRYLKDKKVNPRNYEAELEAELSLSNPKTLATYAAWLFGGLSFGSFRTFVEEKLNSGEWTMPELPFLPH